MKLSALSVVLLALGIVLGLALRDTVFVAEAKPPEPEPQIQPVEEQNVDANGYIAVHEQRVADVNVTNASLPVSGTVEVGNVPAVQDVNVVSMPSQAGRLIQFGPETVPGGATFVTPYADVSACGRVTLMAKSSSGYPTSASVQSMSPDGTVAIAATTPSGQQATSVGTYSLHNLEIVMPFMRLAISNGNHETPADLTGWIWCAP